MVDCYSTSGVLNKRDEYFFPNLVEKQCNAVYYSNISSSLNGWLVPSNVTNNTMDVQLLECDYYEQGKGYIYSLLDNGIGPVILKGLKNSTLSLEYAAMSTDTGLNWDWYALRDILLSDCSNTTLGNSSTGNGTGSGSAPPPVGGNNGTSSSGNSTVDSSFLNINTTWE
jgi:hypothetical protein